MVVLSTFAELATVKRRAGCRTKSPRIVSTYIYFVVVLFREMLRAINSVAASTVRRPSSRLFHGEQAASPSLVTCQVLTPTHFPFQAPLWHLPT